MSFLGLAPAMSAQYLISYPGLNNPGPTNVVNLTTFAENTINLPGVFQVLNLSTGAAHFFVSNQMVYNQMGEQIPAPIFETNQYFQPQYTKPFGLFSTPLTSAVLSPNEEYVVASESTVHIFTVQSLAEVPGSPISVPNASGVVAVVVGYDSQVAYALATNANNSYLVAIDLSAADAGTTEFTITQTLPITGLATSLTLGPNGLLYVTLPNQILEVNPITMMPTTNGTIAVGVTPGPPVFTPDGHFAVTNNLAPVAGGEAAALIDLTTDTETSSVPYNGLGNPITQLNVASSQLVYAFVSASSSLYTLQIGTNGGMILSVPTLPSTLGGQPVQLAQGITAFGTSPDLGAPGRNYPQYILVISQGSVYAIDPVSLISIGGISVDNITGGLSYYVNTLNQDLVSPNPVATVLAYNVNQTVPLGGTSLPLVIRALDQNGYPVGGAGGPASVDFLVTGGGTDQSVAPMTVLTGANGYAAAVFTAGTQSADVGTTTVSTDLGNNPPSFSIAVGTSAPVTPATLSIVSGQGQLLFIDPSGGSPPDVPTPLTVLATDSNGDPMPGVTITFTLNPSGAGSQTLIVVTDSTGQASANFPAPGVGFGYPGYATQTATASAGTLSVTFYMTTIAKTTISSSMCAKPPCIPLPIVAKAVKPASGTMLGGSAGATLPGAVQISVVTAQFDLPVPNVGVSVNTGPNLNAPNTTCASTDGSGVALTNAQGIATCNLVLNSVAGTLPLMANVPAQTSTTTPIPPVTGFATLTITRNMAAAIMLVSGNNQAGLVGDPLFMPLTIGVTDANGEAIGGAAVTWQVTSGPLTLGTVSATTDENGQATATGKFQTTPGPVVVTATVDSQTATFNLTAGIAPDTIVRVSGSGQSAQGGNPFPIPLVVNLTANGMPAAYAPIAWSSDSPAVVLPMNLPTAADANGQSSIMVTAGMGSGFVSITATSGGYSTTFQLTVLSPGPSNVTILNGASFQPSICPGALVSLFGSALAPTIQGVDTNPFDLAAYAVTIGGNSAPLQGLVNLNGVQQMNVLVPFELSPGATFVTIQTPQGAGQLSNVTINPLAPGIFTSGTVSVNGTSFPLAAAIRSDGSYVTPSNPAHRGENITFYATGLGQTIPTAFTGLPGVPGQLVAAPVFAGINHQGVAVLSAVYSVGAIGVYQVSIQVPETAVPGPGQPLSLYMVDEPSSTGYNAPDAYIPIQ